ncbi:MAG: MFS transporter [Candidatus Hydrogenedentes bacterium]|nr:MFS transporter [Candidatus Hydrogenedentota bacterium]
MTGETTIPTARNRVRTSHYAVLMAAFFGWMFDGYEMGIFPIVASPALQSMVDPGVDVKAFVGQWMGIVTAAFLLGAAAGGWVFGWLGDKIGRVRAMSISILAYSVLTGLGGFATEPWHFVVVRFLSGLGMGGEWSLGVALVMEVWPAQYRPLMAGVIGAASNVGFLLVGMVSKMHAVTPESWRWMWFLGVLPAIFVFFIRLFVPESERWQHAVKNQHTTPLREVLGPHHLSHTLLGVLFAAVALIGTWGTVQWIPVWIDQWVGASIPTAKADAGMLAAIGAIAGCIAGPLIGGAIGRRPTYFLLCLTSLIVMFALYRGAHEYGPVLKFLIFAAGFTTASFYGWLPLFLPELFPTRMRATGQGVCFNSGRVFAAIGAVSAGRLIAYFDGDYTKMGTVVSCVYIVGMLVIWFAPETKGKPLPE